MAKTKRIKLIGCLDMGIFPYMVSFCVGYSYDEICSFFKKRKATDWLFGLRDDRDFINKNSLVALKREWEDPKSKKKVTVFYIIFTRCFDFSDFDYCTLAHECLHICQFALPDFLDRDREHECEAYLHTHLMKQCLKLLKTGKNQ